MQSFGHGQEPPVVEVLVHHLNTCHLVCCSKGRCFSSTPFFAKCKINDASFSGSCGENVFFWQLVDFSSFSCLSDN